MASIGSCAFEGCSGLTSITIPESVTSIGESAFSGCSSLASITIPESSKLASIGNWAFKGCSGLTSITIPESVTSIGHYAFEGCSGLTSITIPESSKLAYIGYYAFYKCSGLTSITIPESVTSIGERAFSGCSGLTSITIPESVTSIGDYAFALCSGLTSINIPEAITYIGSGVFFGCSGLTSINIPEAVTSIGSHAFSGCSGLTSITIPESVTSFGYNAFYGCSGLKTVALSPSLIENDYSTSTTIKTIFGNHVEQYILSEKASKIGKYAFSGCSGLTSITIPESVTSIGEYAFENCTSLLAFVIPNKVTRINRGTFYGCKLQSLTVGTSVNYINKDGSFSYYPSKIIWLSSAPPTNYDFLNGAPLHYVPNDKYTSLLNDVRVYPTLTNMFEENGVIYAISSTKDRTCDVINSRYDSSAENIVIGNKVKYRNVEFTIKNLNYIAFVWNNFVKTLKLNTEANMETNIFNSCQSLQSVEIENEIESIPVATFAYNSSLREIVIPKSVKIICNSAFEGCKSLSEFVIPESVDSIGTYAFANCSLLDNVIIPDNVRAVGEYAFGGTGIKSVSIGRGMKEMAKGLFQGSSLESITIPSNIKEVGNDVFTNCTLLKNVFISNRSEDLTFGLKGDKWPLFDDCPLDSVYVGGNIGYYYDAKTAYSPFFKNTSLRTITFNEGENVLNPYEFYMCTNLERVELGSGIESVGEYAFSGCTSLRSLISRATVPPACGKFAFENVDKFGCTLYVPGESIDAYASADQWSEFFFIEDCKDVITNGIENIATDADGGKNAKVVTTFSISGNKTNSNAKGIQIRRMSDGTVKKVLVK